MFSFNPRPAVYEQLYSSHGVLRTECGASRLCMNFRGAAGGAGGERLQYSGKHRYSSKAPFVMKLQVAFRDTRRIPLGVESLGQVMGASVNRHKEPLS